MHSSQHGASLRSPTLETRPCQGCGREAYGHQGSFRHAWIGANAPVLFPPAIVLEIARNLIKATEHDNETPDEMHQSLGVNIGENILESMLEM